MLTPICDGEDKCKCLKCNRNPHLVSIVVVVVVPSGREEKCEPARLPAPADGSSRVADAPLQPQQDQCRTDFQVSARSFETMYAQHE